MTTMTQTENPQANSSHSSLSPAILWAIGAFLALVAAYSGWSTYREGKESHAKNALYLAEKKVDAERKNAAGPVASRFPEGKPALEAVVQKFAGTRPAYDAAFDLGNLLSDSGESKAAIEWYAKAAHGAPGKLEKGLALAAQGYAQEAAGDSVGALNSFEQAKALAPSLAADLAKAAERVRGKK